MAYSLFDAQTINRTDWSDYIASHPNATVFHAPFAYDFLAATSSHRPFALFVCDDEGIVAMLAGSVQTVGKGFLSRFTRRSILMQTPLYNDSSSLDALLKLYNERAGHNSVYSEIRNHVTPVSCLSVFEDNGFLWEDHLDIFVDLSQDIDVLASKLDSSRRKQINRGIKRGLRVFVTSQDDINTIKTCHGIVCSLYKRIALPPPEWEMLAEAFKLSCDRYGAKCFVASYEGTIIGARFVLYANQSIFDWFAASVEEYYHLYPNDVLPWEVFKWGHEKGFKRFDFGGAGKPNVPYGVRDYKLKFGGSLENTGRMVKIHKPINYFLASKAYKMMQKVKKSK